MRRIFSSEAGSTQSLNGAPLRSAPRARWRRHVMPGIVGRFAAPDLAQVFGDDPPVMADYDVIGVGMELDRSPDSAGVHRIVVVVEADEAQLRH